MANIKSQIKRNTTTRSAAAQQGRQVLVQDRGALLPRGRGVRRQGRGSGALRAASTKLDKAASKGVIHKNQAANRKSAMAKLASTL